MSDDNTNPPTRQAVFIATHTATISGTPLTAYVGRINGAGEQKAGVKLSDFTRALDGKRRLSLSQILSGNSIKPAFKLDIFCLKHVYPLQGKGAGRGQPQVILTEGIAELAAVLIEANAAGRLKDAPRLQRAAAQLALLQVHAASEGWRVAVYQAVGLNPHTRIAAPEAPVAPDPALLRAQAALARERRLSEKLNLERQRFEQEQQEALARAMETTRDDLKAIGRLPEAQEVALTVAANEYRTGVTHSNLLAVDEKPNWKVQSEVADELQVSSRAVGDIARSLGIILPNKKGAPGKCEAVVTKAANVDRMVTVYRFSPEAIAEIGAALPDYIRAKPGRRKKYGHLLEDNAAK